jgi:hypothetical protein
MVKKTEHILETDLYQPLHDYLVNLGYTVQAEVNHCDIVATKGAELVIVELKSSFNATLLIQAVKRQKMTDAVYLAIPRPKLGRFLRRWQDLCHLVRRLELGLILVDFRTNPSHVEVIFHPGPFAREQSKRRARSKTAKLLTEVRERHGNYNTGGCTQQRLMTVYKENSLQIACYLERFGPMAPRQLVALGTGTKTGSILQKNYYHWFERVAKGVYQVTPAGVELLRSYPELVAVYLEKLKGLPSNYLKD